MGERQDTYLKAAKQFTAVASCITELATDSRRKLSAHCGIPFSTGYRITAALEKAGILERDPASIIVSGVTAKRIGFSAWGFGQFADISPPVLFGLRQETSLTSFVGFQDGDVLCPGIFSIGRGPDYALPGENAAYRIWAPRQIENVVAARLEPVEAEPSAVAPARAAFIRLGDSAESRAAVVGLMSNVGNAEWTATQLNAVRGAHTHLMTGAKRHE